MKGILYGVGVGPGDPELLTAKAIRLLRECDAVAAPKSAGGRQTALDIASPYIGQDKSILLFDMPMTHDRQARNASHDAAADALCALLDEGKSCRVLVPDDQLSLAIGKEGQNARLAAKLTGWKIDIKPASAPADEEPEDEADVLLDDEAETEE